MTRYSRPGDATGRQLSDAGCFASDAEVHRLYEIDISGAPGSRGSDGQSYYQPPPGSGQDGRRGGDATRAQPGSNAGQVVCELAYAGDRRHGRIALSGVIETAPQQPLLPDPDALASELAIDSEGYIFVRAVGGRGGDGGNGGDGQPGSKGSKGRNATRFSRGGNGGPGGDGGDGGDATDGAPGGQGGQVTLKVDEHDQGLLMLIKGHLSGGEIGFAGKGGKGGQGGPGGDGGSSYHWTEHETYRDSEGNTKTRTISRSNPGGSTGRSGHDGRASTYRAKDGQPGDPGQLRIFVSGPDRQSEYSSPYDLALVTFDIASEYSVLEPDSLVSLDQLTVINTGGMPTPPNYTIRVLLESDRWVLHDDVSLVLSKSLLPGETYTFSESGLKFRLGDYLVNRPRRRPFVLRHMVSPQARMESGIGRPFRQFPNGEGMLVRFPVQLSKVTSLNSLAPGESTRVIWEVTNTGTETFDHKHLYRAVQTHVRFLGGDIDSRQIVFFDDEDQPHDVVATPLQCPLRGFAPGDTRRIETRIGIKDDPTVVPYHGMAIGVDLQLQRPKSSNHRDQYRCADYRQTFIRVSERYQRQQSSRFLLVANRYTNIKAIEQWTQMADYFGSSLDVWDVSYYGFFDLVRDVDKDASLLDQWRGMTIIVPNNYYETPAGRTVAFRQLAKSQFLKAAADYDINFYIVGDSHTGGAAALQAALIPVSDDQSPSQLKTQKAFLKEVRRWTRYIQRSREVVGGASQDVHEFADTSLGAVHELEINKRTFLFQPKPAWLEQEARRLQRKLRKTDPLHRWVIVHRYDSGDTDTGWGFFRKRQVGKLEVRRTLDSTKGSAVLYEVDAIDMVGDEFIPSVQNKHGMFLALKFEDKVDRFVRLVSERTFPRFSEKYIDRPLTDQEVAQIGHELVDSILVDIYNEQKVARESKVWGRGAAPALLPKLNYLAERALNYGVTYQQMQDNTGSMELLFELIANIRYIANESMSVWDSAFFPTAFFKRSRAVSHHMLERSDRIVTSIFGRRYSWWDRASAAGDDYDPFGKSRTPKAKGLARITADEKLAEYQQRLGRSNQSLKRYTTAQNHPGLTYDPELLSESERVIAAHVYDQLVKVEQLADQHRQQTEIAVAQKRQALLVPLESKTPLAVQTRTVTTQTPTTR